MRRRMVAAGAAAIVLLLLIVAATLTVSVLDSFEGQLASLTQLAVFVPLLVGTGGNVGAQAATTVVRALAIGEVRTTDFLKVAWRECRVGLLLGAVLSAFAFAIGALWGGRFDLALSDLDWALRIDPRYAEAYAYRGNVKSSREDFHGALADAGIAPAALAGRPKDPTETNSQADDRWLDEYTTPILINRYSGTLMRSE